MRISSQREPDDAPTFRVEWHLFDESNLPSGICTLRLYNDPGKKHIAEINGKVRRVKQRQGHGTQLMELALDAAREHGCRTVLVQAPAGSDAENYLRNRDFRAVLTYTMARLTRADIDVEAVTREAKRPRPGFRLESFGGAPPAELMDAFLAAQRAIDDQPQGEADYGTATFTAQRAETFAAEIEKGGRVLRTVLALTEDGQGAGYSQIMLPADGKGDAEVADTAVLSKYRRQGLARWMKYHVTSEVLTSYPEISSIGAGMASDNTAMIAINEDIGFRPTGMSIVEYQRRLDSGDGLES